MQGPSSPDDRLLESILHAALESEALFTVLIGSPAVARFSWVLEDALRRELLAAHGWPKEKEEHSFLQYLEALVQNWDLLPDGLRRSWPRVTVRCDPFKLLYHLYLGHQEFNGRLTLYCINTAEFLDAGLECSFLAPCHSLGLPGPALHHLPLTHGEAKVDLPLLLDAPFSWIVNDLERRLPSGLPYGMAQAEDLPVLPNILADPVWSTSKPYLLTTSNEPYLCLYLPPVGPRHRWPARPILTTLTPSGIASLGWYRSDWDEPLKPSEIATLQYRFAVLGTYKLLKTQYPSSRQLLCAWIAGPDLSPTAGLNKSMALFSQSVPSPEVIQAQYRAMIQVKTALEAARYPDAARVELEALLTAGRALAPFEAWKKRLETEIWGKWILLRSCYVDQLQHPNLPQAAPPASLGMQRIKVLYEAQRILGRSNLLSCFEYYQLGRLQLPYIYPELDFPAEQERLLDQLRSLLPEEGASSGLAYLETLKALILQQIADLGPENHQRLAERLVELQEPRSGWAARPDSTALLLQSWDMMTSKYQPL